ncbi:hypothetical protein Tco_1200588 [Tanacetum coccineum]
MLRAARVQVPEYDLYDLKLKREEDRAVETLDPQFCMGSEVLQELEVEFWEHGANAGATFSSTGAQIGEDSF